MQVVSTLRKLELLIIYSYADLHEFLTKIRLLNKATRELTEDSSI